MMLQPGVTPPYAANGQAVDRTGLATSPANATASFRMNSSGVAESAPTSGTFSTEFTWKAPWATAGDYEVKMDPTSGSFTSGTTGTYQALSSSRTWTKTRTNDADGTDTVVATCTIRHAASQLVVATFTVTLNATVVV